MIRHTPAGRGHPYLVEPDQRVPLRPLAGETVELRATAPEAVAAMQVELAIGPELQLLDAIRRGDAVPDAVARYGVPAPRVAEGHLTDAAERDGEQRGRTSWAVTVPVPPGETVRYRFGDGPKRTRWYELTGTTWQNEGGRLRVEGAAGDRLVDGGAEWLSDGDLVYRLRFALRLRPGERVVGFGERFDSLDQRGRLVDTAVFDQYKGQGARSYLPVPFAIVVGGGFGFHVDTGRRVWFDVGNTEPDTITVEVDLEPGEIDPVITLRLPVGSPADVLREFLDATGPPTAPPDWVYRLWMSANEWNSDARVRAEVELGERAGIEAGVIVLEAWSDEQTFAAFNGAEYDAHPDGSPHRLADFTFAPDGPWPDPKRLVDDLHERGLKVLLWQIPLAQASEVQAGHDRRTMIERGYCVRRRDGKPYRNQGGWFHDALLLDFTNPEAADWWLEKRRYLVEEVGVDGFKTDGGEHAWGADLVYADGTHGGETNNRYPVLYGAAYHRLLRSCGRAPVTFSRAGFTGSAAIPCHWAGDEDSTWEAFRASITAGLTAGASGIFFWGWDLAGFSGPLPSPELYLRAAAMAALSPVMQYHSEFNFHREPSRDRTPWNVAEQTGAPELLPVFRRFVRMRNRLVPYIAEQGRGAAAARKPLMRALFFDVKEDARVWDFPYQYLLGDDVLVAPVCEEGTDTWTAYLPAGSWVDAWTGDVVTGEQVVERAVPIHEIPVYLAATRAEDLLPVFAGLDDERDATRDETLQEVRR